MWSYHIARMTGPSMSNVHTRTMLITVIGALLVGTFIVLGIMGIVVFNFGKDPSLKRRWFPRFIILHGVLFVVFCSTIVAVGSEPWLALGLLFFTGPAIAPICYLNIKTTRFCDKCGVILIYLNWFSPMRSCSKCGAALDDKPEVADDKPKRIDDLLD